MALSASTIWEVQTGGDDTNNSGAFDPSQTAGMLTDGAATSATDAAPVFSSASYNFVAGDVGAWVYIASGTNWIAGWYKIASVASNVATLDATIGHATLKAGTLSIATGCATTASPTSATWTIDYSQQTTPNFTYTDLSSTGVGLTVSSAAHSFGKQHVGNSLVIISGTNFTPGRYVIASISGTTATVVGAANIHTAAGTDSNGVGSMGGCLATIATGLSLFSIGDQQLFVKLGTYNISSALSLTSVTNSKYQNLVIGYTSVHWDTPTGTGRPTVATNNNAINALNMNQAGYIFRNFIFDGSGSTKGLIGVDSTSNYTGIINCKITGFSTRGANFSITIAALADSCEITSCGAGIQGGDFFRLYGCWIHDNTGSGFISANNGYANALLSNIVSFNAGASSDGLDLTIGYGSTIIGNTITGNGRDGIRGTAAFSQLTSIIRNNILANHTASGAKGLNFSGTSGIIYADYNAFYNNASNYASIAAGIHDVTLSADPFVDIGSNNFALNKSAGGGALLRTTGFLGTFPAATTVGYQDIGAVQHRDFSFGPIGPAGVM